MDDTPDGQLLGGRVAGTRAAATRSPAAEPVEVPGVELVAVDPASAEARGALTAYYAELDLRLPSGFDAESALAAAARAFLPPGGTFVVARRAGRVVGCGALQRLDGGTAEVKRMWVDPAARGLGLGRRLLAHLEACARAMGCSTVVLDTNASLTEALRLYRSAGYVEVGAYNDNPDAEHWFAKPLG